MSAESVWFSLDSASYMKVQSLIRKRDITDIHLGAAWNEILRRYRQREEGIFQTAEWRAARSKAKTHAKYLRRKARGAVLNGPKWGRKRALFGTLSLKAEGKLEAALNIPQTVEIQKHSMLMGVKVRGVNGRFASDLAYIVPVNALWKTTKKLNPGERNDWSQVIVRDLIRQIEGP